MSGTRRKEKREKKNGIKAQKEGAHYLMPIANASTWGRGRQKALASAMQLPPLMPRR